MAHDARRLVTPRGRSGMRRPRAAHVAAAPEFVRLIMLHDLRRLRASQDIVLVCPADDRLSVVAREGFDLRAVPIARKMSPLRDVASVWQLWRTFRRERVGVVHTYTPKAGLLGQLAAVLAGVPVRVHSCRGLLYTPAMPPLARTLFRATDRLTNAMANRTLFVSEADLRFSVADSLCPAERARWTGNGIDLTAFDPARVAAQTRAAVRAQLGVPADATVGLTVARFVAAKGYPALLDAARDLLARHPGLWLVWVAPELRGEAEVVDARLLEDAALRRVVRLRYWDDMPAMYAAADFLVHPSHREGVPRAVMEALAMGLPIVATDIPGARELLVSEPAARMVPVGDAAAIVREVNALLDAGVERSVGAELQRRRARVDHTQVARRVEAVYAELLPADTSA